LITYEKLIFSCTLLFAPVLLSECRKQCKFNKGNMDP